LAQGVSTGENAFEAAIGREKINKSDMALRCRREMRMHRRLGRYMVDREVGNVNRGQLGLVRATNAAVHVRASGGSKEASNKTATVGVAVDLYLLARLAEGLKVLVLRLDGSDVDVAIVEGRGTRWAAAEVCEHHFIGTTMRRDCADAGGGSL
jgi:hypothetical protein